MLFWSCSAVITACNIAACILYFPCGLHNVTTVFFCFRVLCCVFCLVLSYLIALDLIALVVLLYFFSSCYLQHLHGFVYLSVFALLYCCVSSFSFPRVSFFLPVSDFYFSNSLCSVLSYVCLLSMSFRSSSSTWCFFIFGLGICFFFSCLAGGVACFFLCLFGMSGIGNTAELLV